MTRTFALLQLALLGLHALDLYATSRVPLTCEGNPFMRMLWKNSGFGGMVLAKSLVWILMLAYHLAILKWLPDLSWVVWITMILGFAFMVTLVIWNFYMLHIGGY